MLKKLHIYLKIFLMVLVVVIFITIYRENISLIDCPSTDVDWEVTETELFYTEGEYLSSYASVYGGLTYTYEKTFFDCSGIVKYMFNDKGVLTSIAWEYDTKDVNEIQMLYDDIYTSLVLEYGESDYSPQDINNFGNVWHLSGGNIVLSVMKTSANQAIQVAYINPKGNDK